MLNLFNGDGSVIRTVLNFAGIRDLHITTDRPETEFKITFGRFGQLHEVKMNAQDIINQLTGDGNNKTAQPQSSKDDPKGTQGGDQT